MEPLTDQDRWFSTPENSTWCRLGGNGPMNVSQLMPIVKYVKDFDHFFDVGCGSGTTLDALKLAGKKVHYKGVDFIESRVKWLKEKYNPYTFGIGGVKEDTFFEVEDARKLNEEDKSWDIVWSRHVVDHMESFENALDEQCRVAKRMVICVLWYSFTDADEHSIKPIFDNGKTYADEYLNQFSRKKVKVYLEDKCKNGWQLLEFREHVSWEGDKEGKGDDTIIVLERI